MSKCTADGPLLCTCGACQVWARLIIDKYVCSWMWLFPSRLLGRLARVHPNFDPGLSMQDPGNGASWEDALRLRRARELSRCVPSLLSSRHGSK